MKGETTMKNDTTRTRVEEIVERAKTTAKVKKALMNAEIKFNDTSNTHGYFNLEIPQNDGFIRIYIPYKSRYCVAQKMTKVKMVYSGIPVFFG